MRAPSRETAWEMFRRPPYRSKQFLAWAKMQRGPCCVCRKQSGSQLHHFGDKGMGQKATDLFLCRVCPGCHTQIQGKRATAFRRLEQMETWADIQADGLELLCDYVEYLEQR